MKKFLRSFCAVLCCVSILMGIEINASALSESEIAARLAQISQLEKYTPGASTFGANGCWVFVNSVSNLLFGINIPNRPNGYLLEGAKGYWECVTYAYGGNATDQAVAEILRTAKAGDIIQYRCDWAKWQHTAMIYSNNGGSVTLYDFASLKVLRRDVDLKNLPNTMGTFGGMEGYGLTLYRCKHDVSTSPLPNGGGNSDPITVTTKGADTITETGATLRGDVKSTGAKVTECGMYIGTSKNALELLGSDKGLNTYGTPSYYNTNKYGYPLQPGTVYYYQAYAVVGGKTIKGGIESFTTRGVAPTPTPTPTLTPTPTPIPTPTPTPTAKSYQAYIDTAGMEAQAKYCERAVDKEGNVRKINGVYLYDKSGAKVGSLKRGDTVTVEPGNTLPVRDTDDVLVYVASNGGKGYVWDAYLSDTQPTPEPTPEPTAKPYKAYIDLSAAAPEYQYCSRVIDERTGKVLRAAVVAYYDENGEPSAEFKQGDAVTVQPEDWMYGRKDTDVLVYVTSSKGSGYVWDAYLSSEKESTVPVTPPPITPTPLPETFSPAPETSTPIPTTPSPVPESPTPVPETPKPVPETPTPAPETTIPAPPKTPVLRLSANTAAQGETVTISWEMEPGVEYQLHYSDPKNTLKKGPISIRSYGITLGAKSPHEFSNLSLGEHKVYITAINKYGSVESEEVSFTVK